MSTMKAFTYNKFGDASVTSVTDQPIPTPPAGAVQIKIKSSSLNPIDYKRRGGAMKMISTEVFPVTMGYDASGIISAVGEGVTEFKVGDEVYTRVGHEFKAGTVAEYTIAHVSKVAPKPKTSSFEEAASYPLAAITAMQMLRKANFKAGDNVFVTAGAGGVGIFLIQLARNGGAARIVTTASSGKHELLKSLGATECIDYKTADYKELFKARPFDIALDLTSEGIPLCSIVKEGGVIVSAVQGFSPATFSDIGMPVGSMFSWILYFMNWSLSSATAAARVTHHGMLLSPNAADLIKLTEAIDSGKCKTVITVFEGIEKSADAVAKMESGRTTGKVVIKIAA